MLSTPKRFDNNIEKTTIPPPVKPPPHRIDRAVFSERRPNGRKIRDLLTRWLTELYVTDYVSEAAAKAFSWVNFGSLLNDYKEIKLIN